MEYKVGFAEKLKINMFEQNVSKTRVTFESHNFYVLKKIIKSITYSRFSFLSANFLTTFFNKISVEQALGRYLLVFYFQYPI